MKRPLADKRPIGPFAQPGGVNELQYNFRFNLAGGDTLEDMEKIVIQNAPPLMDQRSVVLGPDVRGEVVSVTADNQMVFSDLEAWERKVVEALKKRDTTTGLDELVIIGL